MRGVGLDVTTVVEVGLQGAADLAVVRAAASASRTILKQDLDFGRIFVERDPQVQIVVLRSRDPRPAALAAVLDAFLKGIDLDEPTHASALFVVGERGYRVRHR